MYQSFVEKYHSYDNIDTVICSWFTTDYGAQETFSKVYGNISLVLHAWWFFDMRTPILKIHYEERGQ